MSPLRILLVLLLAGLVLAGPAGAEPELLDEAERAFRARKYAEALSLYEGAASAARTRGDRSTEVEALAQVARMYSATDRLDEGRPWLARAGELARPEEPLGWTRYLGVRGIFERESGDQAAALATFELMYAESLRLDLPLRAIDAAHHAALVATPEEQIAWAHRGIAAAEAAGSEGWLAVLWNNLGATYDWDLEDYPKAVECYEKARYFHHLGGDPHAMLVADWALGRAALLAGDLALARELLPVTHEKALVRLAENRTASTLEWAGNAAWWHGELLHRGSHPGLRVSEALAHIRDAREHLIAAGIESWWAEGLSDLNARITELSNLAEAVSR